MLELIGVLLVLGPPVIASFVAKEQGKNWKLWFVIGLCINILVFFFLKDDEATEFQ